MGYNISFSVGIMFGLIAITILITIFVGGFMTIIASYSKNSETFFMLSGIIGMPLMFLSNVFFKPESLPFNLGVVGKFNPLNYMVDTIRYLMLGPGELPPGEAPWMGPVLILVLAIGFTFLGTYIFVRTVKK
jgi:ABC-type polysaccharide/polyol phosphate export permease